MILDWDLLVFMGALGIAAFSPGPGLAAVVATVLAGGAKRALWFCGGVILGDLAWLALSLSGLAVIAQQVPVVFTIIKWVGVAYLAYLAVRIWRAPAGGNPAATSHAGGQNALTRLLSGFTITMGNPKTMLFYMALLPSLLDPASISLGFAASLSVATVFVLVVVLGIYVAAATAARGFMANSRSVKRFNRVTAGALGGAAVWIASR